MSLGKEYLAEHVYERYNDNSNNNPICKYCDKCPIKWEKCNGSKYGADGCPLQSLEQHDNEVRREFAEKITNAICGLDKCRGWDDEHQGYKMAKRHAVFAIDDLLKQYEVEE